ncbi:SAM-dependent methyltransferase [Actinomadura sp. LCR2-06]|uniref:SAM-dependent methyltransferase n=1 Tax=Actinomadura violacea TaxID=2819934 RepID=A0ABS3S4S8_9ACTN|nr:SAM-dependent methyltransferase [Actinomadura violacea]
MTRAGTPIPLSSRQRDLVFALLAGGGGLVPYRQLLATVWDAGMEKKHTLHTAISKLREKVGAQRITRSDHPEGYQFVIQQGEPVDLWVWARLLHECAARYTSDPHTVADLGNRALEMCDLDSLEDLTDSPAMVAVRQDIVNDYLRTVAQVAEIKLNLGQNAAVIAMLPRLVQRYDDREHLRGLLMTALYRDQQPSQALALYDDLAALRAESGRAPTPGLQELRSLILANDLRLLDFTPTPLPVADQAVDRSGGTEQVSTNRMTGALIIQDPHSPDAYSRFVDRAGLLVTMAVMPDIVRMEQQSHEFVEHVVRTASQRGIGRFLELSPPLPLLVHKAAKLTRPTAARTVYAHHDAAFVRHLQVALEEVDAAEAVAGTIRDPGALLEEPLVHDLIGLQKPMDEREPVAIIDRTDINVSPGPGVRDHYRLLFDGAAPGSLLALVCVSDEMPPLARLQLDAIYDHAPTSEQLAWRTPDEVLALVPDGLRVLAPGVVDVYRFCASPTLGEDASAWRHFALIAVKE